MAEPEMAKKKSSSSSSSMTLDSSLLSDSVRNSFSYLVSSVTAEHRLLNPDWSLLPEEIVQLITKHVEKNSCIVDAIRARSVCSSWRSTCQLPSPQKNYPLSSHNQNRLSCTKIPLFLFRVKAPPTSPSEYFLGGISRKDHQTEFLPSPTQCSVNMLNCQILSLGHRYRIIGLVPKDTKPQVALLPLNEECKGGGFIMLFYYCKVLWALTSFNQDWIRFETHSNATCQDLFTFRGKFYVIFVNGDIFVINPYNLKEVKSLRPPQDLNSSKYLVPSNDDEELFLVEKINPTPGVRDFGRLACRVSKLDEETGEWVVVSGLGDRVLFIGQQLGNVSCSVKELSDGCGLTKNSILFTNEPCHINYAYTYGAETGSFLRLSRENRVLIFKRSPSVVAFRVEIPKPNWSLLPENLLQLISTHLEKRSSCFFIDAIHARSVCRLWRSTFPLPDVNQSYKLPLFTEFTRGMLPEVSSCIVKKFPLFLFRVKTSESPPPPCDFFLGEISREKYMEVIPPKPWTKYTHANFARDDDESEDDYSSLSRSECFIKEIGQKDHHHTELSSPFQCLVKADFREYFPILTNMLDCQILPLGQSYKLMGSYSDNMNRTVAFLPLNKEEGEFAVLLNSLGSLLVLRSSEMRWIQIERITSGLFIKGLHTFRRKFYVIFHTGEIFVIDPYNPLEVTPLVTPQDLDSTNYLVPSCDNDDKELFLVERIVLTCTVSKLVEETGEWIVVSDLGDRGMIIGLLGNVAFPVKGFPDGCGLSQNSILFTGDDYDSNVTFLYKYDDHLGFWRLSTEDRVLIRKKSPSVLALRSDRIRYNCFL